MNIREFAEFHKYLAILYYNFIEANKNYTLSEESQKINEEIIEAIQKIMKVCVINNE